MWHQTWHLILQPGDAQHTHLATHQKIDMSYLYRDQTPSSISKDNQDNQWELSRLARQEMQIDRNDDGYP